MYYYGTNAGSPAEAAAAAAAAASACPAKGEHSRGARAQVGMGPLPLTLVTVLRRRSARPSFDAASKKAAESWSASWSKGGGRQMESERRVWGEDFLVVTGQP
jgi:hypothetical protein